MSDKPKISEFQIQEIEEYYEKSHRHGHVTPQPHGMLARCGGPALCKSCMQELAGMAAAEIRRLRAENEGQVGGRSTMSF